MKTYVTRAGDMWDLIAYEQLGSCAYTEKLINANRDKLETFIFSAGTEIKIPDVETVKVTKLPPWRR